MDILNLPVEIGALIFNYFDLKTKINIYNSSYSLREYFGTRFHLKKVNLSRSTLATVETLDENLFLDLGHHVKELNLSGVIDLRVDNLKPHMKRFKNLTRLDLTSTQINLQNIHEICPDNLRAIGINFFREAWTILNTNTFSICKDFFRQKHFEIIHFVVFNWTDIEIVFMFLEGTHTEDLKLTISSPLCDDDNSDIMTRYDNNIVTNNFDKLSVVFGVFPDSVTEANMTSGQFSGVSELNFDQLEYIFIVYSKNIVVNVSPILSRIFSVSRNNLTVIVTPSLSRDLILDGNIHFKAWNKDTTEFDDFFFRNLLVELKDFFPTYICTHCCESINITDCSNNWCCIDGGGIGIQKSLNCVPEKITLSNFCRSVGRLVICRAIGVSLQTEGLENLTYLHINKIPIKKDFFTVLFTKCPKLATLVIFTSLKHGMKHYSLALSKSIQLSKLKNFMMITSNAEFDLIFEILSRCPTLENVHIRECEPPRRYHKHVDSRYIVLFIRNCINLCNLLIETSLSPQDLTLLLLPLKVAADSLMRKHLWIEVCDICFWYHFIDVFSPSPLLPMD